MGAIEGKQVTNLSAGDSIWVKKHVHELAEIPEPPEKWTHTELGHSRKIQNGLTSRNLIVRHDYEDMSVQKRRLYSATPELYEAIQLWLEVKSESDRFLPCGHDGFVNQGNVLECKRCGVEHMKSEVDA